MTRRAVVTILVTALLAAGCSSADLTPPPAESRVDVDTPALREAKRAADIAPCPAEASGQGSELPDLELACLGGGDAVDLSEISGPAVIPLWASWCEPCKDELPLFQRLSRDLGDRALVLGVDYQDTQPDLALELLRSTGARFPQLADPAGSLAESYRIPGLPGILWVREDGSATFRNDRVSEYGDLRALVSSRLGVDVGAAG